ncbi:MAG: hypothetical protein ACTSQF_00655 [Candidatus Heimdallarchaeaceae archaeon]
MSSETNEQVESFDDFKSDLLADLDVIELVPENLWTVIRPTLYFSIPGVAGAILGYWLMTKDADATVWEYLLLVVGVFFIGCGILFSIVGLVTFPRARTEYSFTNQGLTIKPRFDDKKFVAWKEMDSLEVEGTGQGYAKRMKCIIRTSEELIEIKVRGYYEPSSKSRNSGKILDSIKQYYERMK